MGIRTRVVQRVGEEIYHQCGPVANVARTEQGQCEIRPAGHAPIAQCLTEVFVAVLDLQFRSDIDQSAETEHSIGGEPCDIHGNFGALELQRVVQRGNYHPDIVEYITHTAAHDFWNDCDVALCRGLEHRFVHGLVEAVDLAIEWFHR